MSQFDGRIKSPETISDPKQKWRRVQDGICEISDDVI